MPCIQSQISERKTANLNLSGIAHLPSFIFWADQSWKKIIANDKFYPFSTMDPSLKSRYQNLSQHLIAQTAYQNPNKSNGSQYSGKMYSLGRQQCYEEVSQIGIIGIAAKFYLVCGPLFDGVKKQHNTLGAPGLETSKILKVLLAIYCSLYLSFPKRPHKDDDASHFTFIMRIPIQQTTGNLVEENFEVKGGEFVFPDDSCGITLQDSMASW
ncbi:hypothetical protein VP01_10037g1, partial [Puccinia sorghi]